MGDLAILHREEAFDKSHSTRLDSAVYLEYGSLSIGNITSTASTVREELETRVTDIRGTDIFSPCKRKGR
jgi:hypothetical protein